MTKSIKICIAVVVCIFLSSVVALIIKINRPQSCMVEIVQDNEILYEIDISNAENQKIRIEAKNGGWNEITIENGEIRVSDADCPDKTCQRMGYLDAYHNPIVCLPHKLIIKYKD